MGRVISYTVIGECLGAIGGLTGIGENLQATAFFQGVLKLLAGLLMVLMGVQMLGLFPAVRKLKLRLPFSGKHLAGKGKVLSDRSRRHGDGSDCGKRFQRDSQNCF